MNATTTTASPDGGKDPFTSTECLSHASFVLFSSDYSTAQKRINAAVNERDLEAPLAGNEANHFDLQSKR